MNIFTLLLGLKRMQYLGYVVDRLKKGLQGKSQFLILFLHVKAA